MSRWRTTGRRPVATGDQTPPRPSDGNLLEVSDLAQALPDHAGLFKQVVGHVRAVDGVSFTIPQGQDARAGRRVRLRQDDDQPA